MAERFGGKYSPNTPASGPETGPPPRNSFDGKRPDRAGGRVNVLFVASLFLLIPAFTGGPDALLRGLGATALLLLASWLTREGVIAQDAYDARRVARRPAIPRKMFGSVLIGLGLALGASISQPGLVMPVLFGLAGAALHLFSFGPDPLANKGMEGTDTFQTDRVARAVDEAEKVLAGMKDAILRAQDRQLEGRVDRFTETARAMFRTIENDPRDLTAARKYLSVYLTGARDATVKFADHYRATRDAQARTDYVGLLDDLESNFTARTQLLLTDNRTDLDVEIGVLRERLQREG
ncbi:MAG: 5-bromo-4-chloroindolyl phosphate hydrolysis family protein [Pseudomonadota bacterium]